MIAPAGSEDAGLVLSAEEGALGRAIDRIAEIQPSGTDATWVDGAKSFKATVLRELRLLKEAIARTPPPAGDDARGGV